MSIMSIISTLKDEWVHPRGVLLILMLAGPEVIQNALAQLSGRHFTPVAFSFGWVLYAFKNLSLARLMPEPDFSSVVINGRTGYVRNNHSWVLGRILRDFDDWKPKLPSFTTPDALTAMHAEQAELSVFIFRPDTSRTAGVPVLDFIYFLGIATTLVQLVIAFISVILHREWGILLVTGTGILLTFITGALPQWKVEKWGCSRAEKTIILTHGNGAQHALVIEGELDFLDLENFARISELKHTWTWRFTSTLLVVLWIGHLITVLNIEQDPWFLLAIGGIGMIHNTLAAEFSRRPEEFGVHLTLHMHIARDGIMGTLKEVERRLEHVGASMLATFFPGRLQPEEREWWDATPAERAVLDGVHQQHPEQ